MFKRKRASNSSVVGLELDPGHVAAAEVHVNGSLTLERGAVAHLRPGVLRDGDVTDPAALTETLRTLFEEHDLPKRVRLGIANQRIVVRTLDVPVLEDEKALLAAVRLQAPDQIPMPIDEAILDMQPLGTVQTLAGPRSRVVVVAVRREMVERVVGAVREAGLELEGLDLSAFGMVRAVERRPVRARRALHQRRRARQRRRRQRGGLPVHARRRRRHRRDGGDALRAPRPHVRALPPVDGARRPRHAARPGRRRRRARGRRALRARGGRAPDRRHRAQLAQLLPHAGERGDGRPRHPHRPRRRRARPAPSGSPSCCACRSTPSRWRTRTASSTPAG